MQCLTGNWQSLVLGPFSQQNIHKLQVIIVWNIKSSFPESAKFGMVTTRKLQKHVKQESETDEK